ncbi:DUF308 domain-containing protein [Lactobacillus sp. YT155]|uniref:HdeD family acid-resistance protein n=1 Tax=Lactobacillus sp. YT155 TaxID=3060955 RepID=UPI00265EF078|nr:DUF308 domain-containing protein [Lactobacillus sp. YT155]MDO1604845.1 DUF308 domain-containing protein [Lactobacillus sp. YT155]
MENRLNKFDPFGLIIGILSVIVAVICLRNPLPTFAMVIIIAAIIAIGRGIYKLFSLRPYMQKSGWLTFSAILDILVGLLMLFNGSFGLLYVAISFAIMFITDSVMALGLANITKGFSKGYYWLEVIMAVLGIIFGIVLLVQPGASVLTISFIISLGFMTFGIGEIAHSI